jgi:hypothetical protein
MIETVKNIFKKIWNWIDDSPTVLRWILLVCLFYGILELFNIQTQEIRVSLLLVWYSIVSTTIASFMSYVYGKVHYHKTKEDNPTLIFAQIAIFVGVYLFSGLVILGTYIAQYN